MLRPIATAVGLVLSPAPGGVRRGQRSSGHRQRRRVALTCAVVYLHVFVFLDRTLSSVVALGASIICSRIPGLAPKQRIICQGHPDAIVAAGEGAKLGSLECRYQFRNQRWNCSVLDATRATVETPLGHISTAGTKEIAYAYAIRSAGVAHSVTQACSLGNLLGCGCDKSKTESKTNFRQHPDQRTGSLSSSPAPDDDDDDDDEDNNISDPTRPRPTSSFTWGGCSADIKHGLRFSRVFLNAREVDEDSQSLMNVHNNGAGRKALLESVATQCKCHGVSGSCSMKTCWIALPQFRIVGDRLMSRYSRARPVEPIRGKRAMRPIFLRLKRRSSSNRKPLPRDLVFLEPSPNYCEFDAATGSPGTRGRLCNRTIIGAGSGEPDVGGASPTTTVDGCESMCCGRGYDTRQTTRVFQCRCRWLRWCCDIECRMCSERIEEFTCK